MLFSSPPENRRPRTASPEASSAAAGPVWSGPAPLVDPAALQALATELDNPSAAKGFARDYARMWEQRYSWLASALGSGDQAEALEAALSLKTSSAMVGGVRLAEFAGELEVFIRSGDLARATSLLAELARSGSDTVDELRNNYDLRDG